MRQQGGGGLGAWTERQYLEAIRRHYVEDLGHRDYNIGLRGGFGGPGAEVSTRIPLYPYTVVPVHPACIHMYPHVPAMHPHVPACIHV
jgi:hypothetical protein